MAGSWVVEAQRVWAVNADEGVGVGGGNGTMTGVRRKPRSRKVRRGGV